MLRSNCLEVLATEIAAKPAGAGGRGLCRRFRSGSRLAAASIAAMLASNPPASAAAHRVECPTQAPPEWHLAKPAPLAQPAVLSQPIGQSIDETAPPTLVPDQGYARGDVWHNLWRMGDEPGWAHFVDCRYRGSNRVLRLKADGLQRCEQTARPYSAGKGVASNAVHTMTCD